MILGKVSSYTGAGAIAGLFVTTFDWIFGVLIAVAFIILSFYLWIRNK